MQILYADKYLVMVSKPAGIPSQPDPSGQSDLLTSLQADYPTASLIHRLDTPTGGVMVFGLAPKATAKLCALVQDHSLFCKEYLAVLRGHIEKDEDTLTDLLFRDASHNKSYVVKRMRKGVREAKLSYRTVGKTDTLTLVRVALHTGRTHQIRVQFSSRGLPLLGDIRYGSKDPDCTAALWSYHLSFAHPVLK